MRTKKNKKLIATSKAKSAKKSVFQKHSDDDVRDTVPNEETELVTIAQHQYFSGPIPSPKVLAQYHALDTELPNRIVAMTENEQKHRRKIEQSSVEAMISAQKRGNTLL